MSLLNPIALALSALAGAIVLMYLLKLRRRREDISSTLLWRRAVEDLTANAPLQKLRRNLLMYLQILALLLMIAALTRPTLWLSRTAGVTRILMIDNSASMNAADGPKGSTRLAEAKEQAHELVRSMAANDQAMTIVFGGRAQVLSPLTRDKDALNAAIDRIEATDATARIVDAIRLAKSVREVNSAARMTLISDGGVGFLGDLIGEKDPIDFFPVGASDDNRGIVAFDLREAFDQPGKLQAFAEVENFAAKPVSVRLLCLVNEDVVQVREATVPPKGRQGYVFDGLAPGPDRVLRLKIDGQDALATDDTVAASLEFDLHARLTLVSNGNFFLERLLALLPGVHVERVDPASFDPVAATGVVVFDQFAPAGLGPGRYLFIDAVPPLAGFSKGDAPLKDQMILDWNQLHPITRFVDFGALNVAEALKITAPDWMTPLAESQQAPLILAGQSRGIKLVAVAFDLYSSDWPMDVSFPIFLANAVRWLGSEGSGQIAATRHQSGETVIVASDAPVEVKGPDGGTWTLAPNINNEAYFSQTLHTGVYRLTKAGKAAGLFTVNLLSPEESDIAPRRELVSGEKKIEAGSVKKENREIWPWALALGLGLLMLEWHLYCRRSWL